MKENRKNVGLIAYERIKEKILRNELDLREKLNDDSLSRELSLSRTPVREAFIMLEKEGLLTRSSGRGFYIQQFSMKDVYDFYEFRNILETASVDLIISNVTDENINELHRVLEEVQRIIKTDNPGEALAVGLQFHIRIIEICKNDMIINSLKNCYDKLILMSWACYQIEASKESAKEHKKILSALKSRDLDELRMRIHQHIVNARDRTLNMFKADNQKLYFLP